jgi:hypothetical protein
MAYLNRAVDRAGAEQAAKAQAYAANEQRDCVSRPPSDDPASLRGQAQALNQICERINAQRSTLHDIAVTVLGESPACEPDRVLSDIPPVGGLMAEIVEAFKRAASLLDDVDREVRRLQRVSS